MAFYYFFAFLVVWQGIISLRGGINYLSYIKRALAADVPAFGPAATVFVPCRGLDQGLRANLESLFGQDYPDYELIFVVDRADDPAAGVVEELIGRYPQTPAQVIEAGAASESGQKVHNLRVATLAARAESEVFVFVDSDARPARTWLRDLVAPHADEGVGATTGYRWFVPEKLRFSSLLRAVWNASIASALGPNERRNFCWGGSTAIRRATFERLNVRDEWRGTLSDDFALTRALQRARLPIRFVPRCLVASIEDVGWRGLVEFTTRQVKITRVYAPHLWQIVLWTNLVFVAVFCGGVWITLWRWRAGEAAGWPLAIVLLIFLLGGAKAAFRLRAVALALPAHRAQLRRTAWGYLLLWPAASLLYAYNAIAALFSRRIEWRGIAYELKSPNETVIMRSS